MGNFKRHECKVEFSPCQRTGRSGSYKTRQGSASQIRSSLGPRGFQPLGERPQPHLCPLLVWPTELPDAGHPATTQEPVAGHLPLHPGGCSLGLFFLLLLFFPELGTTKSVPGGELFPERRLSFLALVLNNNLLCTPPGPHFTEINENPTGGISSCQKDKRAQVLQGRQGGG